MDESMGLIPIVADYRVGIGLVEVMTTAFLSIMINK